MYDFDLRSDELQWNEALYLTLRYAHIEPFNRLDEWIAHIHPEDARLLNQAMDKLSDPAAPG